MDEPKIPPQADKAFDALEQESRVARTARMLDESLALTKGQRTDIIDRFRRFIAENDYTQKDAAREMGMGHGTLADTLRGRWDGRATDRHLVRMHNWMELTARRGNILRNRKFVETSVAVEVMQVANIVAETCGMGVIFGPARIGKTMTLQAIEGDASFGDPVLIRVDESLLRPLPLARAIAAKFDLKTTGTFDVLFRRIKERLAGTKRMLVFDEIERANYKCLEFIRDLHDQTGCPVLLSGKPTIYAKLGFRHVGDFSEVTDQLAARIVIRRDLTERTRGKNPKPLFSLEDIRKLIHKNDLKLKVSPDAEKWLQSRASSLGAGGFGKAVACLYMACKVAYSQGDDTITAQHLDDVEYLTMGHEDAAHISDVVAQSSSMRRVV